MRWLNSITDSMDTRFSKQEGQGNRVYCSPCGHKEPDTNQRLNNKRWKRLLQTLLKLNPKQEGTTGVIHCIPQTTPVWGRGGARTHVSPHLQNLAEKQAHAKQSGQLQPGA